MSRKLHVSNAFWYFPAHLTGCGEEKNPPKKQQQNKHSTYYNTDHWRHRISEDNANEVKHLRIYPSRPQLHVKDFNIIQLYIATVNQYG